MRRKEDIYLCKYDIFIDDANAIDNVNSSRDCLLSTDTNAPIGWTFDGLVWKTATSLWRRMINGQSESQKSKAE